MRMTYEQKIKEAESGGIEIPNELSKGENIVGIYKIFKVKENEKFCFYIGKSTDIAYRLLGSSGGHIYMYLHDDFSKIVLSGKLKAPVPCNLFYPKLTA